LLNRKGKPESCHKLFHILKTFVDGDVYQTGWLFHELNQKLAQIYKLSATKLSSNLIKLSSNVNNIQGVDLIAEEIKQSCFLEIANTKFEENMLQSAGGWNKYTDSIISVDEISHLVELF